MSQEISIVPQIEADRAVFLERQAARLDRMLDSSNSGPKPIAQTGILEEIGSLLVFFLRTCRPLQPSPL